MDDLNTKLSGLVEISKLQLAKILNSVPGPKDITFEPGIIRPLERICGVSWLKKNGIEKIYKLEPTAPKLPNVQFYMIYSDMKTFNAVLELIQSQLDLENPKHNKYHVICVPKHLYVFEDLLEELGLYHSVIKLYSLQWYPIQLDAGLMSLELPGMYRSLYVQQNLALLPTYAKTLWHLRQVFGGFGVAVALGAYSNAVLEQLGTYYGDEPNDGAFGGLLLLDRSADYASALLTPRTYTALLKETYTVHCGVCEHKETSETTHDEKYNPVRKKQPVQFPLDSTKDKVYRDIKHRYFTEVTAILSLLTKQLRNEGESSRDLGISQIKNYVKTQLQAITTRKKNITNHLVAAEAIVKSLGSRFERQIDVEHNAVSNRNKAANYAYLEELLYTENDRHLSLALMCLLAVTQKLSESECRGFLEKYFLEFGYDCGFLYQNLVRANFVPELSAGGGVGVNLPTKINIKMPLGGSSNNFYNNANKLKQIPVDSSKINLKSPTCCSYVYGGSYVPLVSQAASLLLSGTPLEELKTKLSNFGPLDVRNESAYPPRKPLLVCVVGGITYSEVAALNLLESLTGCRIVVLSDRYISGRDITEALLTI